MEASESLQLRPGLWHTINERYPGAMIVKQDAVPLAALEKSLRASRLSFVSSAGVELKGMEPFDVVHPVGDFSFRAVPSRARAEELEIHQIKYPTSGARQDINVIFPIDRLRELVEEGAIAGLTDHFFSFIGYTIDPAGFEHRFAPSLARAVAAEKPDVVLLAPA